MDIVFIILVSALLAIGLFEVFSSVREHHRRKRHNQHFLSNSTLSRMSDILTGCPVEFVRKYSKLILPSSTYCRLEPEGNERIIIGHNLVPDPYDNERMLTIFITNSSLFPYFLADESDIIDLVDARIHYKGDIISYTDDDDCVTAVDGHIEESEAEPEDDESLKEAENMSRVFAEKF